MKQLLPILLSLLSLFSVAQVQEIPEYKPADTTLYNTIKAKDKQFFDAYNNCDLETQAELLSEDIEFFHDVSGLSTSKADILKATETNICGKVKRILIEGSIEVYKINNYGAVEIGYHKFFNAKEPNSKSIPSKFIVIWKLTDENWQMTKIISLH